MQVQPFLGGLVVVGVHQQDSIGTNLLGMTREAYRLTGGIRAGPGNDRDPAIGKLDCEGDDPVMLIMAESRTFSCGPTRHQTGDPTCDLCLDDLL